MIEKSSNTAPIAQIDLLDYKISKLPVDEQVVAFFGRMALEEKADQNWC
ncbi:MAG: hypothetical protein WBZ48_07990 [Bacteroidota bacterium]